MAERGDEAELAAGLFNPSVAGRAGGAVGQRRQGPEGFQLAADVRERQVLVGPVFFDLAQRHGLDQGQVQARAVGPLDHRRDGLGVVVLERHGVDLDLQPGTLGRLDPGLDLGEVTAPGDPAERVRIQAVEGDVEPPHAQTRQLCGEFGQPGAVGGEGQLLQGA